MIIIKGKYNEAKVFTKDLEKTARDQIQTLCDQPFVQGSKIRIMPDVHAGAGCTIGTTMTIDDKVVPNLVGVDIGCGMETIRLLSDDLDFKEFDQLVRRQIPSGFSIRRKPHRYLQSINLKKLRCRESGKNDKALRMDRAELSLGTLGGGNHFIEINRDERDRLYLVVHSGSRNLGLQVALYYQRKASALHPYLPRDLAYLDGRWFDDYLHDMQLIQQFAVLNRKAIVDELVQGMSFRYDLDFTTIHNYIDLDRMILRKGAISALKGERVLIPLNMRDGSLICEGLGNRDWNYSAPHGAGRVMSRTEARKTLSLKTLHEMMRDVYTTSINRETLDESPEAYKPASELIDEIGDTVKLIHRLRPVYNFKARD
ncbi:MAG TPA: RtcB family protein [Bacillota bacterium]|nr:RtcB family protein [Bacillota bacterium]HQC48185.1 RtcB family protein [Bacillota bacterium]